MSYSFSVRAATKAEAVQKVAEELAKVVIAQPVHEKDQANTQTAAESFIGLLRDDDSQDIAVSVSGSCWGNEGGLNSAGISIGVSLTAKVEPPPAT